MSGYSTYPLAVPLYRHCPTTTGVLARVPGTSMWRSTSTGESIARMGRKRPRRHADTSEANKFGLFPGSFRKRGRGGVHTGSRNLASALATCRSDGVMGKKVSWITRLVILLALSLGTYRKWRIDFLEPTEYAEVEAMGNGSMGAFALRRADAFLR